jgi:hypothetical protein
MPIPFAVSQLFLADRPLDASVTTRMRFDASPEAIWDCMMFYEEIPVRPSLLLRTFLPTPVRTSGDKTELGAPIQCTYTTGHIVKRITVIKPPRLVRFEVVAQHLGFEHCALTASGSYEILRDPQGAYVALTTNYKTYLRPRWFWRRLEKLVATRLHRHILNGMRAAIARPTRTEHPAFAKQLVAEEIPAGDFPCTTPSHSRR